MAENQKTNLATVRFSSGVGNTLQIKFPKVVSSEKDNTEYIYYTKEGDFLGGNENSNKVYITTQEEYNKSKNKIGTIHYSGYIDDGEDILSIHKMSAKHLGLSNNNGWDYFWILDKEGEFISLNSLRYLFNNEKV